MLSPTFLLGSQNIETIQLCYEVADELGFKLLLEEKIEDFLLAIQQSEYQVILFDLELGSWDSLKSIKLIRRMRPKIPLLVFASGLNRKFGGKILSEGVFQLMAPPLNKEQLIMSLGAAFKQHQEYS
ncbi:MAG: hypothetical protein GXO74_15085 [Calditrichaeota bacterium]|nr:hypothetical protein [Calditrichota bacterium]